MFCELLHVVLTSGNKSKPEARYTELLCLQAEFTGKILQGPFFFF